MFRVFRGCSWCESETCHIVNSQLTTIQLAHKITQAQKIQHTSDELSSRNPHSEPQHLQPVRRAAATGYLLALCRARPGLSPADHGMAKLVSPINSTVHLLAHYPR